MPDKPYSKAELAKQFVKEAASGAFSRKRRAAARRTLLTSSSPARRDWKGWSRIPIRIGSAPTATSRNPHRYSRTWQFRKQAASSFRISLRSLASAHSRSYFGDAATGSGTFAGSGALTVSGAALGDFVLVGAGVDVVDAALVGHVTSADTVEVTLLNNTACAVDLASQTLRIVVLRMNPAYDKV